MPHKSAKFLTAALASTALVVSPVAVQAGQMGQFGMGGVPHVPKVQCPENVPSGHPVPNRSIVINKPVTTNIENNVNVFKPVNIEKTVNVFKPVTVSNNFEINKNIEINKPINITNNINNSKNIEINKNINNSKNIEINKNVNINKNININKGSSQSEAIAVALAQAVAAALANSNSSSSANNSVNITLNNSSNSSSTSSAAATVQANFLNNASATAAANSASFANAAAYNNSSFFSNFNVASAIPETPAFVGSSEVNVNVSPAEVVAAPAAAQACVYQQATVIKAIHAICVSADHHEFPASHMVGETWIRAAYEGEIARCLPGSTLKVMIGSVVQSAQGAAVSPVHGDTLICGPHEALRHFKNGLLKCAPALAVPDCTERTNLRKFGTGDMFFSYVSRVCLETGQEFVGGESREVQSSYAYREQSLRGSSSGY